MKPTKGAKVVGYRPVTGRPTNPDGTLRLVFEYERPARGDRFVIDDPHAGAPIPPPMTRSQFKALAAKVEADGGVLIMAKGSVVDDPPKPVRRIVDRGIPKQGALI